MNSKFQSQSIENSDEARIFSFGEFSFDAADKILWRGDEIVGLPPKTCELLSAFIENAGRILTKEDMMNLVWKNTFVEEANLSHHIAVLRKSLGDDKNREKFIQTIPRKGYRFVAPVTPKNKLEIVFTEKIQTRVVEEEIELADNILIGREKELAVIQNLLRRGDTRLLTLTGVGGAGKTTLAQAALKKIAGEFAAGAEFIDLSAVVNPALVLATIAQALKITIGSEKDSADAIGNHLRENAMLLILDNFEQIIEAAPQIARIAARASESKILVTSRARLHLSIEHEFQVPPLELPAREKLPEEIIECAAIRLFVERARLLRPEFELTDENAATIAEICRRLDGLPLAIELAAARLRLLSPASILERLQNQLNFLTRGARDLPVRQQTMRAAIAWSYELLDETEKQVFESLAVFAGGFTLEAAEAVAQVRHESKAVRDVLDVIESLIDENLLQVLETIDEDRGETKIRFRFLEAIREFALERLEARGTEQLIRHQHAEYFLAFADQSESDHLRRNDKEKAWTEKLRAENDNLRAALGFLLDTDAEKALQMAVALHLFWVNNMQLGEGRQMLSEALQKSSHEPSFERGRAFKGAAMLAWKQGAYNESRRLYAEALRIGETIADKNLIAIAKNGLGIVDYQQNELAAAKNHLRDALELSREVGDDNLTNSILIGLGEIARLEEDYAAVLQYNLDSGEFYRRHGYKSAVCGNLINLGAASCLTADFQTARTYFTEAAQIAVELDFNTFLALCFDGFAAIALAEPNLNAAAMLAGAAENLYRETAYTLETPDRIFREKYLAALRQRLDENDFANLFAAGSNLPKDEAVKLALKNNY